MKEKKSYLNVEEEQNKIDKNLNDSEMTNKRKLKMKDKNEKLLISRLKKCKIAH